MSRVRKTSASSVPRGVVYDLAERRRRRQSDLQAAKVDGAGPSENDADIPRASPGLDATPEGRAERVARLKSLIAAGQYNPDPREVARHLLERGF